MPNLKAPHKIGLVGTFEVANYGDCLFPVVYMHLLRERMERLEFSFHSPLAQSSGIMDYGPIQALPSKPESVAFDVDALILCGGETLWFGHSAGTFNFPSNTMSAYLRLWLAPTIAASRGETDFIVHSVGTPIAKAPPPPEMALALASATRVTVRDAVSAARLGDRFAVEVDPVFALSSLKEDAQWEAEARKWLPAHYERGQYIAAHVSAPYLAANLADWCEQVAAVATQTGLPILLVPVCHFMDDRDTLTAARDILIGLGLAPDQVHLAPEPAKDVMATAALLGMSAGVITSSLHACVTAVSFGLPLACFVGAGKADGKHKQTLLAAGVDYGMAMEIADIAQVFADAMTQDCAARRDHAVSMCLAGIEALAECLTSDQRGGSPLSEATIKAMLEHDRAVTRDLRFEAKRTILRVANKSDFLANLLAARRQARISR